jgi:signal transduction histidine kinase
MAGLRLIPKHREDKGLGLGLLMAHAIVLPYGGTIRIDSPGPKDTTITICLPRHM